MGKALFWDLQGTLGGDAVASIELFEPYSFSKEALKLARDNGYNNIVITNQSRIGKELFLLKSMTKRLTVFLITLIRMKF